MSDVARCTLGSPHDTRRAGPTASSLRFILLALPTLMLAACTTEPGEQRVEPPDAILSDARPNPPSSADAVMLDRAGLNSRELSHLGLESEFVYVSLAPGTAPGGQSATIRNKRLEGQISVTVVDGGFDPVPIAAVAEDTVIVAVTGADGALLSFRKVVPPRRRPTVVRTSLPRSRAAVPLNMNIRVVFSEPVDPSTVNPSTIVVTHRGVPVPGTVRIVDGAGLIAAFIPSGSFAANAEHLLEIGAEIRDIQGEAIDRLTQFTFTTGATAVGLPVSIRVSPDTAEMTTRTYQMAATVFDADGNELADEAIEWLAGGNSGVTISQSGVVTALAEGNWQVTARLREHPTIVGSSTVKVRSKDPAVSLSLTPSPAMVALEDTLLLTAVVGDISGRSLDRDVSWSSSDTSIATVKWGHLGRRRAELITRRTGSVTITATGAGVTGATVVNVTPPRVVAVITPSTNALGILASVPTLVTTTVRDPNGREIFSRPLTWTSDDPTIAEVDATGTVTGRNAGTTSITVAADGASARVSVTVSTLRFASVAAGRWHSCALTPEGSAYCWGNMSDHATTLLQSRVPVPIGGDITLATLVAGDGFTCGLTTSGQAYCWGSNSGGALGRRAAQSGMTPVAVEGGHVFASIVAGGDHACGLTADGAAWCWGNNTAGQLANAAVGRFSASPVRAAAGLNFKTLIGGFYTTCGMTSAGSAWCWGLNTHGQLGTGTTSGDNVPPGEVTGGLSFTSLAAGGSTPFHTCAIAAGGIAYCWGANQWGQLGTTAGAGTDKTWATPVQVSGELRFPEIATGFTHTCALTSSGTAYCWGGNTVGQLGTGKGGLVRDNPFDFQPEPSAVAGGISFATISLGSVHACGMSRTGVLYCWGAGFDGQLGRGAHASSNVPVKVGGQP